MHQMQVCLEPFQDFSVREPPTHLLMNFFGCRFEDDHVASVLNSLHVPIERLPVIGDQRYAALCFKAPRHAFTFQATRPGLPRHLLHRIGLAEAFQESHGGSIAIQVVHVIDNHQLVFVLPQRHVHTKRCGVSLNPTSVLPRESPHCLALGQPRAANHNQQIQVSGTEGPHVSFQLVIRPNWNGSFRCRFRFAHLISSVAKAHRHGTSCFPSIHR